MKFWDIKTQSEIDRQKTILSDRWQIKKFFYRLPSYGGVVGNTASLLVYNKQKPEASYIITQKLLDADNN